MTKNIDGSKKLYTKKEFTWTGIRPKALGGYYAWIAQKQYIEEIDGTIFKSPCGNSEFETISRYKCPKTKILVTQYRVLPSDDLNLIYHYKTIELKNNK